MILREYLNKLARGKLSNLSLASGGFIRDDSVYKVVDAINESLNRIYTALPIKINEVSLIYSPEITKYILSVQVEIHIYCVFRTKKKIYSVLNPSPKGKFTCA